jgi:hypothetical protein
VQRDLRYSYVRVDQWRSNLWEVEGEIKLFTWNALVLFRITCCCPGMQEKVAKCTGSKVDWMHGSSEETVSIKIYKALGNIIFLF